MRTKIMTKRLRRLSIAAAVLLPAAMLMLGGGACSDDVSPTEDTISDTGDPTDTVADTSEPVDTVVPPDTFEPIDTALPPDVVQPEECELAVNVAYAATLRAAQPAFGTRSKGVIAATSTFASRGGDPETRCPIVLQFKDSNGDGTLQAYEDWTRPAAERAADLVSRLSDAEKLALLAHPTLADAPTGANANVSAATQAFLAQHIRFGKAMALSANATNRARWANNLQEAAEATAHGIPFVLSADPTHSAGDGRVKASPLSRWPHELGLGATGSTATVRTFGEFVAQEYKAIGVRMALSPAGNLLTEPRWSGGPFTFGEDSAAVAAMVAAFVEGAQGEALGRDSVAVVLGHFPGAGAAKGGFDGRLAKGMHLAYPGDNLDAHLAPFASAIAGGVAGVMTAHGVPQAGAWSALDGLLSGADIDQVGASFHQELLQDALRGHYAFDGFVLAPPGVLDDAGGAALGAPWGVESLSKAERAATAIAAGVDQFAGLADLTPLSAALAADLLADAELDAAAGRALTLMFTLGLFEDPYVDEDAAPALVNTDPAYRAGLNAMNASMVLVLNADKPEGFLNGTGDGTQTEDKGNAGNGSMKVLPAPPGEPYVAAGCAFFVMGNINLDYVRSVSAGYGELTNDATIIGGVPVTTAAERIAQSDYVFIRLDAPYSYDADSGALGHAKSSLEYAHNDNVDALAPLIAARAAIDAVPGSKTQIVVAVDGGRPSVVSEVLSYGVSGLYLSWSVTDKVFLDVAFGIVNGTGRLPVGLPASDAAASGQLSDVAGDGQHPTFVKGFGLSTTAF